MGTCYQRAREYINLELDMNPNEVFVEIGGERGEGSTSFFATLAYNLGRSFITVDFNNIFDRITPHVITDWSDWYNSIRGESWPECASEDKVSMLPPQIQEELKTEFGFNNFNAGKLWYQSLSDDVFNNIKFDIARGSIWAKEIFPQYNKKICCLYLDNFDYDWDVHQKKDMIEQQKKEYQLHGIEMNNLNCQVEHLNQMIALLPYMLDQSIVICDDTYLINDCYIGKCGAVVPYLIANDYEILLTSDDGVILKKSNRTVEKSNWK